ncbi:MAG: LCP family protein, partial [Patescibacteria group bacterium]|nr:LCP family protein [Patescibacteria group bacterium]
QLVDTLGGITVDVERTLDDPYYPVAGKENAPDTERYEHLYIPAGRQRFDGELALKYVRSRKAKGAEGSDFARSHRQQQVMAAIRDAAISMNILRPGRLSDLLRLVNEHLDTNLQVWEMLRLYNISRDISPGTVVRHVLDDRPDGLLVAQIVDGAYVLVPRARNFQALQQIAADPFTALPITQPLPEAAYTGATSTPTTALPPPVTGVRLQIQNGTEIAGLAARAEQYFKSKDYAIVSVGNAPIQTYLRTVIYDLKPPANAAHVRALGETLDAVTFDSGGPPPITTNGEALPYPVHAKADILVILGQNAAERIPENF